ELISSIEVEIEDAHERENRARGELDTLLESAQNEGRSTITATENARADALFKDIDLARAAQKRSKARLAKAQETRADEQRIDALSADARPSGAPVARRTASYSVTRNERTYHQGNDPA